MITNNAGSSAGGGPSSLGRNLQSFFEQFNATKTEWERVWTTKPVDKDLFESPSKRVVLANFELTLA